jgi:hypothetical protein
MPETVLFSMGFIFKVLFGSFRTWSRSETLGKKTVDTIIGVYNFDAY